MSATQACVLEAGIVSGVGLSAPASCAAIRVGITGFVETRFMFDGEWLIGAPVPFEEGWRGRERLLQMVVLAVTECLTPLARMGSPEVPLLLCLAEQERPGRFSGLDGTFVREVEERAGLAGDRDSAWLPYGRVAGAQALDHARRLLAQGRRHVVIAGVDTMLGGETLRACYERRQLQTAGNSDGFIPGEAAAAILVGAAARWPAPVLAVEGIGYGLEPAPDGSGEPLRADGLVQAIAGALREADLTLGAVDYRLTDNSGGQYGFKEGALALTRLLRARKEEFDIWHPADCVGDVGAAIGPLLLGVALTAARKAYAPGPRVLCHLATDSAERAAMILATHYDERA